jgi:MFS family permease
MGIISTFLVIRAVRMTLGYRKIISICIYIFILGLLGSFINFGLNQLIFLFGVDSFIIMILIGVCVGFFVIPITALYTAYSVELTYPIAQGSATGYLFAASQTFAFILGMLWITILDRVNKWKVYLMFGVHTFFIFLSLLININTKELLKKTNYELGL